MLVAPQVTPDARDPSWRALDDVQRLALSKVLERPVGTVVHESLLQRALKVAGQDSAIQGALQGIAVSLDQNAAPHTDDAVALRTSQLIDKSAPGLERVFGAGALAHGGYPKSLLEFAAALLHEQGAEHEASALDHRLRGADVDDGAVDAGLDLAFGADFSVARRPSLAMVEHAFDSAEQHELPMEQVGALQDLIAQLDYELEVSVLGEQAVAAPLTSDNADAQLQALFHKLMKGTALPEAQVFQVAARLQAAVNTPSAKPQVIVLAGAKGSGVDELYRKLKGAFAGLGAAGAHIVEMSGASDLRMTDAMGRILGSPNGEAGLVASPLAKMKPEQKLMLCIDGADDVGTGLQYEEDTTTAQRALYAGVAQLQRLGTTRAYDGEGGEKNVNAHGGVIVIRDRRSVDELKGAIPSSVWSQLAPQVVDFSNASAGSVLAQLSASIANKLHHDYGIADADVQLSSEAQQFLTELLQHGMDPEMLQRFVQQDVLPRLMRAAYDENLGAKLRIELSRGVRPKHLELAQAAWLQGKQADLPGVGTLFGLRDEGKFRADTSLISAKLGKRIARDAALEQAKLTILGYQGTLKNAQKEI
ncbi:MAG TPA: hypothetical protein VGO62_00035, partial [Myxococcota bacterium]